MPFEISSFIGGAIVSGLVSWLITMVYYRKSLEDQAGAIEELFSKLDSLHNSASTGSAAAVEQLGLERLQACIQEYKEKGTPVALIDTFTDLSMDQRADLLDKVLVTARGRPAKENKYRSQSA